MNKSKRILSAILASTVALSSYAAYAAPDDDTTPEASSIKVADITLAKAAPETIGESGMDKYTNNRSAVINVGTYDVTNNEITVKVASELLMGDDDAATGGANICLVMELKTAVTLAEDSYGFDKTQIEDIDVADGYKFVEGKTETEQGKYVVLWINAHKNAMENGEKTVVYKDTDGKTITTVKLVQVPVVQEAPEVQGPAITINPDETAETETAIIEQAKTNLGITDDDNLLNFSVGELPEEGDGEVTVTVTAKNNGDCVLVNAAGAVVSKLTTTVKVSVSEEGGETEEIENPLAIIKSNNVTADVANEENMGTFNRNLAKYEISAIETVEGRKTVTVTGNFGEMLGDYRKTNGEGKNVLLILKLDEVYGTDYTVKRIKDAGEVVDVTVGDDSWKTDAGKFIEIGGEDNSKYFTCWIPLSDTRITNGVTYKVANAGGTLSEEFDVKFNDTTRYNLAADINFTSDDYEVEAIVGDKVKSTVKVSPKSGSTKTIVSAKVKKGDGTYIDLTDNNDGTFEKEVTVKELLTPEQINNGEVGVLLNGDNLTVETLAQSDIKVAGITLAKAAPETVTGDDAIAKYTNNRKAVVDVGTYDATKNEITVKVASELLTGDNTGATNGANICLVMELETKVTLDNGSYGFDSKIENIDVEDGYKFVDTVDAENQGKYVVLWINAHKDAMVDGERTVVYKDKDNNIITTVKLVQVPVVKETPAAQGAAITTVTEAAVIAQAKTNLGITDDDNLLDFSVDTLPETGKNVEVDVTVTVKDGAECVLVNKDGEVVTELTTKVKVSVAAEVKVTGLAVSKGIDAPETMSGPELNRYKDNKALYSFGTLGTDNDGNSTLHIDAQFGKMVGSGETATGGKNVLVVLAFDKLEGGYKIERTKDGSSVTTTDITNAGSGTWKEHGSIFVTGASDAKNYFTLWISLTDDRIENGMEFTITPTVASGDTAVAKKLIIDFDDTTEYTLTKDAGLSETDYTVNIGTVTNGKATVTVTPVENKTITAATLTTGDGTTTVALTPKGDGSYAAEVTVKDLLTTTQIQNGDVAAKITDTAGAGKLSVTAVAPSADVVATGMTVGIENPPTMTGDAGLTRYQNNRKLYVDSLVWNATSKTATVKVPAELMDGEGPTGQNAANVCLILKLQGKLEPDAEDGNKYNFKSLNGAQWNSADATDAAAVNDGYKFVTGIDDTEQGKYVVLWIGAGSDAFSGDTKTVIYTDKDGAPVATVNLVKIPGVKPTDATTTAVASSVSNEDIITAAMGLLSGDKSTDNLEFAVGTPTVEGTTATSTVTVTPKGDTVLVNNAGEVVTSLVFTITATVAAETKYTATVGTATNGTIALKVGDEDFPADGVTAGTEVTIVLTADTGYTAGTPTVTSVVSGEAVTVTGNKFNMPVGGVTVSATFTASSGGNTSGGGSTSGGGGSVGGGGGSTVTRPTSIDVTNKTITSDKNAIADTTRVDAKPGETTTDSKGTTVTVAKSDSAVSYVKVEAPATTSKVATWAEVVLMTVDSAKLPAVKKSVEEAVQSVANGNGFALNVDILNSGRKTVEPGKNVEITVPVPAAFKNKTLYAYRITARGAVQVLATVADGNITLNAGGAGEYIITAEKLTNAVAYKKGNVSGNGTISTTDATLTLKHILDMGTALKDEALFAADKDGNGIVNAKDATDILKEVLGIK